MVCTIRNHFSVISTYLTFVQPQQHHHIISILAVNLFWFVAPLQQHQVSKYTETWRKTKFFFVSVFLWFTLHSFFLVKFLCSPAPCWGTTAFLRKKQFVMNSPLRKRCAGLNTKKMCWFSIKWRLRFFLVSLVFFFLCSFYQACAWMERKRRTYSKRAWSSRHDLRTSGSFRYFWQRNCV